MSKRLKILLIFLLIASGIISTKAQTTGDKTKILRISGGLSVTSKGLSTFPNLTLGKPAAVFDFSVGSEKLRFEPTMRFELNGKPWTFIFWGRYEMLKTQRFRFNVGAHPAYAFKTITVNENGVKDEIHRVQMYLAGELAPLFIVNEKMSIGPYYIYANGVSKGTVQNSNFISFRAFFSNINLSENVYLNLFAQTYLLKLDDVRGFYLNATLSLKRRNFPFSISSTINKSIDSTIPGKKFLWNINLTYSFNNRYQIFPE